MKHETQPYARRSMTSPYSPRSRSSPADCPGTAASAFSVNIMCLLLRLVSKGAQKGHRPLRNQLIEAFGKTEDNEDVSRYPKTLRFQRRGGLQLRHMTPAKVRVGQSRDGHLVFGRTWRPLYSTGQGFSAKTGRHARRGLPWKSRLPASSTTTRSHVFARHGGCASLFLSALLFVCKAAPVYEVMIYAFN